MVANQDSFATGNGVGWLGAGYTCNRGILGGGGGLQYILGEWWGRGQVTCQSLGQQLGEESIGAGATTGSRILSAGGGGGVNGYNQQYKQVCFYTVYKQPISWVLKRTKISPVLTWNRISWVLTWKRISWALTWNRISWGLTWNSISWVLT